MKTWPELQTVLKRTLPSLFNACDLHPTLFAWQPLGLIVPLGQLHGPLTHSRGGFSFAPGFLQSGH